MSSFAAAPLSALTPHERACHRRARRHSTGSASPTSPAEDVVALRARALHRPESGACRRPTAHVVESLAWSWWACRGFARKTMDRMSDGECQRVMIARALAAGHCRHAAGRSRPPSSTCRTATRWRRCSRRLAREERKCSLFSTPRPRHRPCALRLGGAWADTPSLRHLPADAMCPPRTDRAALLGRKRLVRPPKRGRSARAYPARKPPHAASGGPGRKKPAIFRHIFCTSHFFAYLCTAKVPL